MDLPLINPDLASTLPLVLIVDDSHTIRKSAEIFLKDGYRVISAEDGFAALPIITERMPDLIFIDVMMPRLDGYQLCGLIKDSPEFAGIPVVILSSKNSVFDQAKGRIAGADEYLTKPFTKDTLLAVVKKLIA